MLKGRNTKKNKTKMPNTFPSDTSTFIKIIESSLNLQIIFHLTVYKDLTIGSLREKMRNIDKKALQEALDKLLKMGLIEAHKMGGETYYKTPSLRYTPKEYNEIKEYDKNKLRDHLNEEFIYSYRMISLIKSIFGKLVHYICDFYINRMQSELLDSEVLKQELKYDTGIPRIGFVTKGEFEIYKNKFLQFEKSVIGELMERRKSLGIEGDPDIEYIIANLIIPIKKVIDHPIS